MESFATIEDMKALWRPLTNQEAQRAAALLPVVSDSLRVEAEKVGRDLDKDIQIRPHFASVVRSVVVDVAARALMTSTDSEPMSQFSQTAGPYSASGTFLVPGGGLFIKKSELGRLGLRRQRFGVMEIYGKAEDGNSNSV